MLAYQSHPCFFTPVEKTNFFSASVGLVKRRFKQSAKLLGAREKRKIVQMELGALRRSEEPRQRVNDPIAVSYGGEATERKRRIRGSLNYWPILISISVQNHMPTMRFVILIPAKIKQVLV